MIQNNNNTQQSLTFNSDNHTLFTIASISELQYKVSAKMALYINKEHASKRNDLDLCLQGEKSYEKLAEYLRILEEIKYCNFCFAEWHPSEIIQAVNNHLNRLF